MDPTTFKDLGAFGIGALTIFALVLFMRPLLFAYIDAQKEKTAAQKELTAINGRLLTRLETSDAVQDRATAQAAKTETVLAVVATKQETNTDALVALVKSLPETVAQIVRATESAASRTIDAVNANADKHDAEYQRSLAEVKSIIGELRTEIAEGHKALRGDVLGRLDKVINLLTPPPPPQLVKHPEPLERQEQAA
jgi:hypothetical protein